jgi:NAD(P)-dependent dehydrogenase (short-subunit alcohol dehydrogenase family)
MRPKRIDTLGRGLFGDRGTGWRETASVAPAQASEAPPQGAGSAAATLNPMFQYTRSPFPAQQQPWLGLSSAIKLKSTPSAGHGAARESGRLSGRRALVIGGESDMGRAAAIAFAIEGADVAFSYLPAAQSDADEVVRVIRRSGRKAVALPVDLRDEQVCKQLVADAVRELGSLDILVSNATRQRAVSDIADMSTEQFDATFKRNIYAMFWVTKAALPHMGPGSSIINTSTSSSTDASDLLLDYSATHGAIMVFTKSLAKQLASRGIRVNAVAPQPIWTPRASNDDPGSDEQREAGADDPVARCGRQVELASTYVLLASNESSYATGQLYGAVGGAGGSDP